MLHCDKVLVLRLDAEAALRLRLRRACVEFRAYRYSGRHYKLCTYPAGDKLPGKGGSRDEAAPETAVAHAWAARVVRRDKGRTQCRIVKLQYLRHHQRGEEVHAYDRVIPAVPDVLIERQCGFGEHFV